MNYVLRHGSSRQESVSSTFVLDRLCISKHMNEAVNKIRRAETTRLCATSREAGKQLNGSVAELVGKRKDNG
jgi:hypothetical protein